MKTLLVLTQHPESAEAIRSALSSEDYRVVHRLNWEEAEPLLDHGLVQACLLDVDQMGVQSLWIIEKLRRALPQLPLLVYVTAPWELEEEAYLKGVTQVLRKPVRSRMLKAVLSRLWPAGGAVSLPSPPPPAPPAESFPPLETGERSGWHPTQTMDVLRNFSSLLTHSLNAEGMLRHFLLFLRETLGINRAAIFLRSSPAGLGNLSPEEGRRLHVASAIGISSGLLEHFQLSLDGGIGNQISRFGRILRRNSKEALSDLETQKEFELLGAQVAVPVLDREALVGVAVFDAHLTGEPLANVELELIFHLLEQAGLGIRNIWLHDQLAANNELMADVLRELSSACIVVSRDLVVLHANKMARRIFGRSGGSRSGDLEFPDLPQALGGKIYQVLKTGTAVETFKYTPENGARPTVFNVTIVPFQRPGSALPNAALLVVEDLTQAEQLQKLEVETANLRLIKTMADRLAHEVGNALVPLATHQQLLADRFKDAEFRNSLNVALADGVKRISRLINQMRFLARDAIVSGETFPVAPLIEEAYQEAQKYQPVKSARLKFEDTGRPLAVMGDRAALKHALAEVLLNALQANPADPQIGVRLQESVPDNGAHESCGLNIEIRDNGSGFAPETAQRVSAPFFTTRNVGLGLGLTVSRKIIETHQGRLEIVPSKPGQAGVVRISLPAAAAALSSPGGSSSGTPSVRQQRVVK